MRKILLFSLAFFSASIAFSAVIKAKISNSQTPNLWSSSTSWEGNIAPKVGDEIEIPLGAKIVLDQNIDVKSIDLMGVLIIDNEKDIDIRTRYMMIMGVGAMFQWGTEKAPYLKNGTFTLVGNNPSEQIIMHHGDGTVHLSKSIIVLSGGKLEIQGKTKKSWTQLDKTALKGSTEITLKEEILNWNINDSLVIAASELPDYTMDNLGNITIKSPFVYQNEAVRIKAISGKTITLYEPLQFQHWGEMESFSNEKGKNWTLDERAEVGLLTRNIKIQGDETSDRLNYGGRIMIMNDLTSNLIGEAKISGVEFSKVGTAGVLGSYPFHWHLCKNISGQYFKDNSISRSYNRAITVHGSQNGTIQNNVIFNIKGHAIFLEDAVETGNTLITIW